MNIDFQEKAKIATKIIYFLSFTSSFYLPNRYLHNLFNLENSSIKDDKNSFIPQDHFIHSVYLYLLGIYVFFYHDGINIAIKEFFKNSRLNSDNNTYLNRKVKSDKIIISDFIMSWRLFSFGHDIGYPWENDGGRDFEKFRKPFFDIKKSIEKELSLRIISKLFTLDKILENNQEIKFEKAVSKRIIGKWYQQNMSKLDIETLDASKIDDFKDYIRLPKIDGPMYARTIASAFKDGDLIAVLESKISEFPVLIIFQDENGFKIISRYNDTSRYGQKEYLCRLAFSFGTHDNSNLYWRYYAINPKNCVENFIKSSIGKSCSIKYSKFKSGLTGIKLGKTSLITNNSEFSKFSFEVYNYFISSFYSDVKFSDQDDVDDHSTGDMANKLLNKLLKQNNPAFINDICEILKGKLLDNSKNIKFSDINISDINESTKVYFSKWNTINELSTDIARDFFPKIRTIISKFTTEVNLFQEIRAIINNNIEQNILFDKEKNAVDADAVESCEVAKKLLGRLVSFNCPYVKNDAGENTLQKIISYKPQYIKNDCDKFIDHGVASSVTIIAIQNIINKIIDNVKSDQSNFISKLLCLGLNISPKCNQKFSEHAICAINRESILAIMMHNLFPENFKKSEDKKYRIKLQDTPLTFLGCLCDTLQPWDRMKSLNLGEIDYVYKTTISNFNLNVRNNYIYISERGNSISFKDRIAKLKNDLDQFLFDASDLIKLDIKEW